MLPLDPRLKNEYIYSKLVLDAPVMNSTDSSTVGAYPSPPGVVPNFMNPESIASRVVLAAALSPVFTIPIVLLRLYTSHFIIKCWHLDDCRSPSSKGTKGLLTQWQSLLQFRW
jgi:hypothetical protein